MIAVREVETKHGERILYYPPFTEFTCYDTYMYENWRCQGYLDIPSVVNKSMFNNLIEFCFDLCIENFLELY